VKLIETALPGVVIIEPDVHGDARGFFLETFHEARYAAHGIPGPGRRFVQDNHSRSRKGVLRGLHFQVERPQGKLVSVATGAVFDVTVDVRAGSPSFGRWAGVELSEENHRQLWIPPGYAHGFCVLSDVADFQYKCTDFYDPQDEAGVLWSDADIGIDWPVDDVILSARDRLLPELSELSPDRLPRFEV